MSRWGQGGRGEGREHRPTSYNMNLGENPK